MILFWILFLQSQGWKRGPLNRRAVLNNFFFSEKLSSNSVLRRLPNMAYAFPGGNCIVLFTLQGPDSTPVTQDMNGGCSWVLG